MLTLDSSGLWPHNSAMFTCEVCERTRTEQCLCTPGECQECHEVCYDCDELWDHLAQGNVMDLHIQPHIADDGVCECAANCPAFRDLSIAHGTCDVLDDTVEIGAICRPWVRDIVRRRLDGSGR